MRAYRALLRKDLLLELRGRELVPAMLAFVLGALVLVRFGLGGETLAGGTRAATGLLWVVVVFTSMLALVRSFAPEREHGIWDGLLAAPVDRAAIWAARATATLVFLAVTQAVALPLFWLFFLQEGRSAVAGGAGGGAAVGRPGRGHAGRAAGRPGLAGAAPARCCCRCCSCPSRCRW